MRWRQPKFWRTSRWQVPVTALPAPRRPWPALAAAVALRLQACRRRHRESRTARAAAGRAAAGCHRTWQSTSRASRYASSASGVLEAYLRGRVHGRWRAAAGGEQRGQDKAGEAGQAHGGTWSKRTGRQHTHRRCRRRVSVAQASSPSPSAFLLGHRITRPGSPSSDCACSDASDSTPRRRRSMVRVLRLASRCCGQR